MASCVFCIRLETEILAENDLALAFYDKYPVNEGHVLIIPRRHVESFFEATPPEELAFINELLFEVRDKLDNKLSPDGYNIGAICTRSKLTVKEKGCRTFLIL